MPYPANASPAALHLGSDRPRVRAKALLAMLVGVTPACQLVMPLDALAGVALLILLALARAAR
jgi:ammonia channel protein AmtB